MCLCDVCVCFGGQERYARDNCARRIQILRWALKNNEGPIWFTSGVRPSLSGLFSFHKSGLNSFTEGPLFIIDFTKCLTPLVSFYV